MLVVISIVSHNQGYLIDNLLRDLDEYWCSISTKLKIVITKNIPERHWSPTSERHELQVVENLHSKGFGRNHNCVLEATNPDIFIISNPDIRLTSQVDVDLLRNFNNELSIHSPVIQSPQGKVEDFHREQLTPLNVIKRKLQLRSDQPKKWLAGMFLIINRNTYRQLNGFDEKFFMYVEDCDLSVRAIEIGAHIKVINDWSVEHDAQRQTSKSYKHFFWHLSSLLYFWKKQLLKNIF